MSGSNQRVADGLPLGPLVGVRGMPLLALLALLAGVLPDITSAQVVRGRLHGNEGNAVGGAMMTLLDRSERQIEQVLARSSGLFELTAPSSGRYRLRAERIGYATTYSDFFELAAGDTLTLRMTAPVEPVRLEGLEAEGDQKCQIRPEEGLAVSQAWEEARKALAAAAWTQDRGLYSYEMMSVRREMDEDGRKVLSEDRRYERGYRRSPYISRPADDLLETGFASITPQESVYWAPDADVLLSDGFLDTHCFRLTRDTEKAPGLVGLSFEPVRGRRMADIAGTLWIDLASAELRWLDFRYRNLSLPRALLASEVGGKVEFEALPNGTWIVNSWRIRMPRAGQERNDLTGGLVTTLAGVTIQGGDVLAVRGNEGTVLEAARGGQILGIVFDSSRAGLPGARVYIEGTGIETMTDQEGRFRIDQLESGVYSVNFAYPYLEEFSYRPEPFEVEVEEDKAPSQVSFAAPTIPRMLARACRNVEQPEASNNLVPGVSLRFGGILAGRVTDQAGQPLAGATVRVLSEAFEVRGVDDTGTLDAFLHAAHSGVAVTTDPGGRYLACWVPVDRRLEVVVADPDEVFKHNALESRDVTTLEARSENVVRVSSQAGHARLDLRVKRN